MEHKVVPPILNIDFSDFAEGNWFSMWSRRIHTSNLLFFIDQPTEASQIHEICPSFTITEVMHLLIILWLIFPEADNFSVIQRGIHQQIPDSILKY